VYASSRPDRNAASDAFAQPDAQQMGSPRGAYQVSPQFTPIPPPHIDRLPQMAASGSQGGGSWIMGVVGKVLGRFPVWFVLMLAVLVAGRVALEVCGDYLRLNAPAPSWVGLLVLAMPVVAIVVSVVFGLLTRGTRGRRYWAARAYGGTRQSGPGMGSYGDGTTPSNGW
jgi:hypothetical protein